MSRGRWEDEFYTHYLARCSRLFHIQMVEKTKEINVNVILWVFLMFMGYFTANYSFASFYTGYHNIDLAWNFKSTNTYDRGSDDIIRSPTEMYRLGLEQIVRGFLLFGLSALIFGISVIGVGIKPETQPH